MRVFGMLLWGMAIEIGIEMGVAISFYYKRRTLTNCPWSVPRTIRGNWSREKCAISGCSKRHI